MIISHKNILLNMVLCMLIFLSACNLPTTPTPGLPAPVRSTQLYVSTSGNDTNDCLSETSPCLTINAAVSKAPPMGGVIQIGAGTFREIFSSIPETGLYINNKALTLRGTLTDGIPATVLGGAGARTTVVVEGSPILIFQDLIIQGGGGGLGAGGYGGIGLRIKDSAESTTSVELHNVIIRSNRNYGLFITGPSTVTLDNVQVLANRAIGLTSSNGVQVTIKNSIVSRNGYGAIRNGIGGTMVISDTTISGNGSTDAAIINQGDMRIERSTVSGTTLIDGGSGAGIFTQGALTIVNSTIAANGGTGIKLAYGDLTMIFSTVAENSDYGIDFLGGSVEMHNNIVENNAIRDCMAARGRPFEISSWGPIISDGTCSPSIYITTSRAGSDPYLGHLADNGGPTQTMAIIRPSPAINNGTGGNSDNWPPTDQRGFPRWSCDGGHPDLGAYELNAELCTSVMPLVFATPETPIGGVPGVIQLYTDTPEPSTPVILTFAKNAYCRKGPSALYRDVSSFKQGDTTQADGRNETDPRWWWVQIPNSTEHCWVSFITVIPNIPAEDLPIQPTAALELPAAPTNFVISKRMCSPNEYSLQLAWTKSTGADGYALYLNGQQIATFKASQTVYQEKPPLNQSLHYELEAFNKNGFSKRLVVEDRCP